MKSKLWKVECELENLILDTEKLYSIAFVNWDSLVNGSFAPDSEIYGNAAFAIEGLIADVLKKMNDIFNELHETTKEIKE